MKSFLVSLAVGCGIFYASALSPQIEVFGESARLMLKGINDSDESLLADAAEGFASLNSAELDNYSCMEGQPGDLVPAVVQFNEDYCDLVRKNNFRLIEVEPLKLLRATLPEMYLVTRGIKAGGTLTFTFNGAEEMNMAIASSSPGVLQYALSSLGESVPVIPDAEGIVSGAVWSMGPEEAPFSLTVTNPSSDNVSFTIAME